MAQRNGAAENAQFDGLVRLGATSIGHDHGEKGLSRSEFEYPAD